VSNLTLLHPWLLALLPLPLLVWWLVPAHRQARQGLVVPFLPRLAALTGIDATSRAVVTPGSVSRWLVVSLCWLCVVLAITRPQLIEPPVTQELPARDLLLAVDLSGSMATADFTDAQGQTVDRLTALKTVLDDFLAQRKGDRVGLILFGSAAFVQVPFTEDLEVYGQLLHEAQVGMAGPQTAFGDALGLAINVFDRSTVKERVLIALTDGNDTSSQVPPEKAAQIAADKGIVIHTVAVGDPRAAGEDALDETTLRHVAEFTGGMYAHAKDRAQLASIYQQIDQLETRKQQTVSHRPRRDVYWWPLATALLASLAFLGAGLAVVSIRQRHPLHAAPATLAVSAPLALTAVLPHLIRPGWLLALLPAALLWWMLHRHTDSGRAWRGVIAPHLLAHLWGGQGKPSRFNPLFVLGLLWLLTTVAIAGPTWTHQASPFAEDTAALAIVVKVSPSMETEDVPPSRLQRAAQKVHDLLQARGNAKTSLVAYAGSAHIAMPATNDAGIIDTFAQALTPAVMPLDGDAAAEALHLADQTLAAAGGGSIVWITDSVAPEQADALANWRRASGTKVRLWAPLTPGDELDALLQNAQAVNAQQVSLTADDSDVQALANAAKFASTLGDKGDARWSETGYWLTPVIALLLLLFFRRGWMISLPWAKE
jgi:Ca-activated chloride channel family protein